MQRLNDDTGYVRFGVDEPGTDKASIRVSVWRKTPEGMDDELIASFNLGDPTNLAEMFGTLATENEPGLTFYRKGQKIKRIRKALGYAYP